MWCSTTCLLLLCLRAVFINASEDCPPSSSSTVTAKLKYSLLCRYDETLRPVTSHHNATAVTFRLILKYFSYEFYEGTLSVDAWMPVHWKDEHLKWNPEDYEGIKSIHLSTDEIWTPDLSVYNRKDQSSDPHTISSMTCVVSYTGLVLCAPPVHIDALCVPDIKHYPYDTQNCTIQFGSWVHKGEEINLKLANPVVDIDDYIPNGEWALLSYEAVKHPGVFACCPNNTYPSINISFEIRRLSGSHSIGVIIPCLVAILFTFTSLTLSPLNKDRLPICYVNLLAQLMHVQYVTWMVPLRGDEVPVILTFARDSMLLSAAAIPATILFKWLMQKKDCTAPKWISGTVSVLTGSRPGQIIFMNNSSLKTIALSEGKEDGSNIIDNSESGGGSRDIRILGKILDVLFLSCYIIVYAVMVVRF